jgi:hypothetical protein
MRIACRNHTRPDGAVFENHKNSQKCQEKTHTTCFSESNFLTTVVIYFAGVTKSIPIKNEIIRRKSEYI